MKLAGTSPREHGSRDLEIGNYATGLTFSYGLAGTKPNNRDSGSPAASIGRVRHNMSECKLVPHELPSEKEVAPRARFELATLRLTVAALDFPTDCDGSLSC